MRYCKLRYVVWNWKYLQKCKKIKVKKPIFVKKIIKKNCQILAVEFFLFNPNKGDILDPCHVQGGVAYSPTSKEHCTLGSGINVLARLLIFKLFSQVAYSYFVQYSYLYEYLWPNSTKNYSLYDKICPSIKFSNRHVYCLYKVFQQACLFQQARSFCTLESEVLGKVGFTKHLRF